MQLTPMTINSISSHIVWELFFKENEAPSFLQSWEWGEVQKKLGYKIERLGIYDGKKLVGIAQVIKIIAKRGNMLFVPHGPIINLKSQTSNLKTFIELLLDYLKKIAKRENYDFIRIAPVFEDKGKHRQIFKELELHISPIYMHAERVWILDITKSEDNLLADMRKTTRYLIRKAEKEGVVIEVRTDLQALDDFWDIYGKTASREHFTPFSQSFIRHEFEEFFKTGNALFFLGKTDKDKRYEAGALIVFTPSTAFYHQGASLHSKIPVAYLMQWRAIQEAKKRGCTHYNFWGTLQQGRTPKSWGGLSLFKQGFGGFQRDYVPTHDYIITSKYYLTYLYELYLKWKRGV